MFEYPLFFYQDTVAGTPDANTHWITPNGLKPTLFQEEEEEAYEPDNNNDKGEYYSTTAAGAGRLVGCCQAYCLEGRGCAPI